MWFLAEKVSDMRRVEKSVAPREKTGSGRHMSLLDTILAVLYKNLRIEVSDHA